MTCCLLDEQVYQKLELAQTSGHYACEQYLITVDMCRFALRNVRRIVVRGVNTPLPPRRFFWKFDHSGLVHLVHSEIYLNKYVVSIAPFSTPAYPDCSQNIT